MICLPPLQAGSDTSEWEKLLDAVGITTDHLKYKATVWAVNSFVKKHGGVEKMNRILKARKSKVSPPPHHLIDRWLRGICGVPPPPLPPSRLKARRPPSPPPLRESLNGDKTLREGDEDTSIPALTVSTALGRMALFREIHFSYTLLKAVRNLISFGTSTSLAG